MTPKKYEVGIVIGRFQPFHLGHKYVLEKALGLCNKIYIGIGSAQIFDGKNPYSAEKRKKFLERFVAEENLRERVIDILPIEDFPDDDVWFERLKKRIPGVEVIVGDNEWVNGIFERHGLAAERIGYYKRHILEGTKIRRRMEDKKEWQSRVPHYMVSEIEEKDE
ncbi:MAG: adenylyltransferase/cytidyltransferase family protein [Candidatus Levyibacteriota bacterium]